MKTLKKFAAFLMALILLFSIAPIKAVAAEKEILTFTIGEDMAVTYSRIMYYALNKLGYEMTVVPQGSTSAMITANSGVADGVVHYGAGYLEQYPNLVMCSESQTSVDFYTYTRKDMPMPDVKTWSDLSGKKVGHVVQKMYIMNHLPKDLLSINQYADFGAMMVGLSKGEIDIAIFQHTEFQDDIFPDDIMVNTSVDSAPSYTYLNKKYAFLAPKLDAVIREMKLDGTMDKFKKNEIKLDDSPNKIILQISSYTGDMAWGDEMQRAVGRPYDVGTNVEKYLVSLDALRFGSDTFYKRSLINTIHRSFLVKIPDVIIATDDEALEFVKQFYNTTFFNTPVVFGGINNYSPKRIEGFEQSFTGVAESLSAKQTLDQMLKMYPHSKNLFVINDYSLSGKNWRADIESQISSYSDRINIQYNDDIPFDQLIQKLHELPKDALILNGFYYVDSNNVYFSQEESSVKIANIVDAPTFSLDVTKVSLYDIGGKSVSAPRQGARVHEIVSKILMGTAVSNIAVKTDTESDNQWLFDFDVLHRYGLSKVSFPKSSVYINDETDFYKKYPLVSAIIVTILFFAFVIILILIYFISRQKRQNDARLNIQKELIISEERLQKEMEIQAAKEQQTKQVLRQQEDLLRVLDSLPFGVLIDGFYSHIPIYVNPAYVEMFKFKSIGEALDYKIIDLAGEFQPDGQKTADVVVANNALSDADEQGVQFEFQHQRRDGEIFDAKVAYRKILFNNKPAAVALIQDVTAEKKHTQMLENIAEQEKEANKIKSKFVANMSHEIRTPMNAVIGLTEIALMKNFDDEAHETFKKVNMSAKNLLSIINDVLDFSKIEAEKLELFEENFVLDETLSNAALVASPRIGEKSVEMLLDLDSNLPAVVNGDKTRLWQIFKNLLDNSAKFTNEGKIVLSACCTERERDDGKIEVKFVVEDTGMGMDEAQIAKIFSPFMQFHQNSANMSTGTGLGMVITKQLIELMGGTIDIKSATGVGTTTTIIIPFKASQSEAIVKDEFISDSLAKYRFLVADDNESARHIIENILKNIGCESVCVSSGEEAIEAILEADKNNKPFDIAIFDYKMGNMNGIETAEKLKTFNISTDIKLLMVSAYSSQFIVNDIRTVGFHDIIEKPFSPSVFIQKLHAALEIKQQHTIINKNAKFVGASVLLVEDNYINQEVATSMLEMFGIEAEVASNGKEALDLLETKTFDLVFMDLFMPVMDGHEATKQIRNSDKPYHDIPIIAMTANVVNDEIELCLNEGMNGHVSKPIDFNNLSAQLNKWLSSYLVAEE